MAGRRTMRMGCRNGLNKQDRLEMQEVWVEPYC